MSALVFIRLLISRIRGGRFLLYGRLLPYPDSFPLEARGLLLLSLVTKVSKSTLVPEGRKLKNHRHSLRQLIFSLPFLLTFVAVFGRCLSVIVSVSPLCFSVALFRTSLFKTALLLPVRYFSSFT